MSSKVSTDLLKSCRSMCERVIDICNAVENGSSNTDACDKFGISLVQFNNILSICSEDLVSSKSSGKGVDPTKEAFLSDLFEGNSIVGVLDDFDEAIDITFASLRFNESDILRKHYFENMSYAKIGKAYEVTTERIRQVTINAMRKLRQPSRIRYFIHGVEYCKLIDKLELDSKEFVRKRRESLDKVKERKDFLDNLKKNLVVQFDDVSLSSDLRKKLEEKGYSDLQSIIESMDCIKSLNLSSSEKMELYNLLENSYLQPNMEVYLNNISIEELNLSRRAYNCLRRANVFNLGELSKLSYNELIGIRNLGSKSLEEILNVSREYGIVFKD